MRYLAAAVLAVLPAAASTQGVPIQMTGSTFACRDLSDMVRLGLRMAEHDKAGFLELYNARQAAGACVPLREGTVALLQDNHDEQGLHLACIKQDEDPVCFWSVFPLFIPAP